MISCLKQIPKCFTENVNAQQHRSTTLVQPSMVNNSAREEEAWGPEKPMPVESRDAPPVPLVLR